MSCKNIGIGLGLGLLASAGVSLLVMGLSTNIGNYGGHKWQVITGTSILGAEAISPIVASIWLCVKKSTQNAQLYQSAKSTQNAKSTQKACTLYEACYALKNDPRKELWITAKTTHQTFFLYKDGQGTIKYLTGYQESAPGVRDEVRSIREKQFTREAYKKLDKLEEAPKDLFDQIDADANLPSIADATTTLSQCPNAKVYIFAYDDDSEDFDGVAILYKDSTGNIQRINREDKETFDYALRMVSLTCEGYTKVLY